MDNRLFVLSLLTARRDYDVAKILYRNNVLKKFFIDAHYLPDRFIFSILDRFLPVNIVKTYHRYQPGIPKHYIDSDWMVGLRFRYEFSNFPAYRKHQAQIKAYKSLSKKLIQYCEQEQDVNAYYGFDTASFEFFEWAKDKEFYLALEQCVAPRSTQIRCHEYFKESIGINIKDEIENCKVLQEREMREWELANHIIVPSQYVWDELVNLGVESNKIRLVPFGYQPFLPFDAMKNLMDVKLEDKRKSRPVILFAGNAGFRKGVHDLLVISNLVDADFFIAGHIETSIYQIYSKGNFPNVKLLGKLPFSELQNYYSKADVFFFPSYLEGSAMVIFEAMSWGLPIVTTHQTGSVVTNGKEGFVVEAGDIDSMVDCLGELVSNSDLRMRMGETAIATSEYFSLERYAENLLNVITR